MAGADLPACHRLWRAATWQQLCGPHLCTRTVTHSAPSTQPGLLPTEKLKRDKSTHTVDKTHKPRATRQTCTRRHTQPVCLFQTHRCVRYKRISLPVTLTYSDPFLHMDSAGLQQTHSCNLPRGACTQPNCMSSLHAQLHTLLPATRHAALSVKCEHESQLHCADLVMCPYTAEETTTRRPVALAQATAPGSNLGTPCKYQCYKHVLSPGPCKAGKKGWDRAVILILPSTLRYVCAVCRLLLRSGGQGQPWPPALGRSELHSASCCPGSGRSCQSGLEAGGGAGT